MFMIASWHATSGLARSRQLDLPASRKALRLSRTVLFGLSKARWDRNKLLYIYIYFFSKHKISQDIYTFLLLCYIKYNIVHCTIFFKAIYVIFFAGSTISWMFLPPHEVSLTKQGPVVDCRRRPLSSTAVSTAVSATVFVVSHKTGLSDEELSPTQRPMDPPAAQSVFSRLFLAQWRWGSSQPVWLFTLPFPRTLGGAFLSNTHRKRSFGHPSDLCGTPTLTASHTKADVNQHTVSRFIRIRFADRCSVQKVFECWIFTSHGLQMRLWSSHPLTFGRSWRLTGWSTDQGEEEARSASPEEWFPQKLIRHLPNLLDLM